MQWKLKVLLNNSNKSKSDYQPQVYDKAEPRYLVMNSCPPNINKDDSLHRMITFSIESSYLKRVKLVEGERKCSNSQNMHVKHRDKEIKMPLLRKVNSSQYTPYNPSSFSRYFCFCLAVSASIVALFIFTGFFVLNYGNVWYTVIENKFYWTIK